MGTLSGITLVVEANDAYRFCIVAVMETETILPQKPNAWMYVVIIHPKHPVKMTEKKGLLKK